MLGFVGRSLPPLSHTYPLHSSNSDSAEERERDGEAEGEAEGEGEGAFVDMRWLGRTPPPPSCSPTLETRLLGKRRCGRLDWFCEWSP